MLPVPCICFSIERSLWIMQANLNGVSGAHVSLLQYFLCGERFTVLLGNLSCFLVTTIRWHEFTSSPNGTHSKTPNFSSQMRSASNCFCQWIGTCGGVWQASFSKCISSRGPVICWSSLCWHTLNVEPVYLCRSQSRILLTFAFVASNGSLFGWSGTLLLGRHYIIMSLYMQFIWIIWTYNNFRMLMRQLR